MCACIFKEGKQGESSLGNRQHHVGKKREKTPKNTPESPPHRLLHLSALHRKNKYFVEVSGSTSTYMATTNPPRAAARSRAAAATPIPAGRDEVSAWAGLSLLQRGGIRGILSLLA